MAGSGSENDAAEAPSPVEIGPALVVEGLAAAEAPTAVHALAVALERASAAGRWDLVTLLAKELEARRLAAAGNVVPMGAKRRSDW